MHECKFEDKIIEIHGDVRTLVAEFKAMNGTLARTSMELTKHELESNSYRRRIDVVWTVVHTLKWILIFTVGYGAGRPIIERLFGA